MRNERTAAIFVLILSMVLPIVPGRAHPPNQAVKPPVVPPRVIHLVKPNCGTGQSCHGVHGLVILNVDVLTDGTAGDVEAAEPVADERLVDAATLAAKKCRFKPGTLNGKPTSMNIVLKYAF